MKDYEQSFRRLYENFVFSLKIYPDKHYQKVLCYQVLEKMDKLFHDYQKLGLPTVQLVHYKSKVKHNYIMNGGTTWIILNNDSNKSMRSSFSPLKFTILTLHTVKRAIETVWMKWIVFFYAMIPMTNLLKSFWIVKRFFNLKSKKPILECKEDSMTRVRAPAD